jgi:hypothetical protein
MTTLCFQWFRAMSGWWRLTLIKFMRRQYSWTSFVLSVLLGRSFASHAWIWCRSRKAFLFRSSAIVNPCDQSVVFNDGLHFQMNLRLCCFWILAFMSEMQSSARFLHILVHRQPVWSPIKKRASYSSGTGSGRPNLIEPSLEQEFIHFCLARERERIPATTRVALSCNDHWRR